MSDNNLFGNLKPEAVREKLLNAKIRNQTVRIALKGAGNEEIDTTAAACGMTREELLLYANKWANKLAHKYHHRYAYTTLSIRCAMRCHDVLQQAVKEIERFGFKAGYSLELNGCLKPGSFRIRIHDKSFAEMYRRNALPQLPDALSVFDVTPENFPLDLFNILDVVNIIGAVNIIYSHSTGTDEKPVHAALNALLGWVKSLSEVNEDMFSAVKIFLN